MQSLYLKENNMPFFEKSFLIVLFFALIGGGTSLCGQNFEDWFVDKTLRVDYIFAGDSARQEIYLDKLVSLPGWYGRRNHLDSLYVLGNGQLTLCDEATGRVIYRHSFSTLFQEWQGTAEAAKVRKAFENPFLLPYPKRPALLTVDLMDYRHRITASLTHRVDPTDILIHRLGESPVVHRYIEKGGDPDITIDVAIVAEGYTANEMNVFYHDAAIASEALFEHEPFKTYKKRFNVVAVGIPSDESGVSIPGKGIWKETAVGSHFDTFYSARYLTTLNLKRLHDVLAGIPYEHIIILANTDNYGGGGILNSYTLTTTHNPQFRPVVVHEFGHSFAGLADEYFYDDQYVELYPTDVEPWEKNLTTLVDFDTKWKDMLSPGTPIPTPSTGNLDEVYTKIGVYEGGGYQSKGVYRAFQECRMKINEAPAFCPVCCKAIEGFIRFYTE